MTVNQIADSNVNVISAQTGDVYADSTIFDVERLLNGESIEMRPRFALNKRASLAELLVDGLGQAILNGHVAGTEGRRITIR